MTTPFLLGSYLTIEEYLAAPTALQTNNLVPSADQATQDAELAGIIGRASRWIDSVARQPLYATATLNQLDSDARIRDGQIIVHGHQDRVKAVTAFAWGVRFTTLTTLTNPDCWIEENRVRVSLSSGGLVWSGALNIGQPMGGCAYVQWSYVAGWVTTRLSGDQDSGDTVVTVDNPNGAVPGTLLRFVDGAVQSTYSVLSVSGNAITLSAPLAEGWPAGTGVSEVPDDIKEAAVLVVSHYIKQRKGSGVVMSRTPTNAAADETGGELAMAQPLAERYQRITP
jgi:hypothetical protein